MYRTMVLRFAMGAAIVAMVGLPASGSAWAGEDASAVASKTTTKAKAKKATKAKKPKKPKKATKTDGDATVAAPADADPAVAPTPTPTPSASPAAAAAPAESALEKLAHAGPPDKKVLRTWKAKCASCHGEDGKGATEQGKKMGCGDMTTAAFWKGTDDAHLRKVVLEGFKRDKDGKPQEMKSFRDQLSADEVDTVLALALGFRH